MTVKELIEHLKKQSPSAVVLIPTRHEYLEVMELREEGITLAQDTNGYHKRRHGFSKSSGEEENVQCIILTYD